MQAKNNDPVWKRVLVRSEVPKQLEPLRTLAQNLWWSWNYRAIELFESIDPLMWERSQHNPVSLLESLDFDQYQALINNKGFMANMQAVLKEFEAYMNTPKVAKTAKVAYFCMEYGLHSVIKLYSGGLGVLAGDYLKEASDCNSDMVAIGLLYRYGYFKQSLSPHGEQVANYKPQKFSYLPVLPVKDKDGNWVKINIQLPGRTLHAKIWKIQVGRVPLYLLDTDLEENQEGDRSISHQLYGGDWENRLKQEILLGIGGVKALDALGIQPEICHMNEGHAAFTGLERVKKLVQEQGLSFHQAVEVVKSSSLFTTHTPVPAGHDAFNEDLLKTYLYNYSEIFQISWDKFMALGRIHEFAHEELFSMSHLAARLSQEINGVSRIHGRVSREMLQPLWPGFEEDELHVDYVTNGVHYYTWTSIAFQKLYEKHFGKNFHLDQSNTKHWEKIHKVPDDEIWETRLSLKRRLIESVTKKLQRDLTLRQESPGKILNVVNSLNENALIIGFARRFATYKRAHLLFSNLDRLSKMVNNADRPVQFIFAGKAHPADQGGQALIKRIIEVAQMPEFAGKIFFLENYDMALARRLVHGVDVWLNTPTRPLEASGTSGMKATMNGVLNLSVLDGWWAEGYIPEGGWALPEEQTYVNKDFQDELDAETLYNIIETQVVPDYFSRNESGMSPAWMSRIRHTIAGIAPHFTMKRMLDEYYSKFYNKLQGRANLISSKSYANAKALADWKAKVYFGWDGIQVMAIDTFDTFNNALQLGENFNGKITLELNQLSKDDISLEVIVAEKQGIEEKHVIVHREEVKASKSSGNRVMYELNLPMNRSGVFDYGFRITPKNKLLAYRHDFNLVRWI
ncbi:MAG: alpha-glucan family phosphorylase [Bacteroidia bacterium]